MPGCATCGGIPQPPRIGSIGTRLLILAFVLIHSRAWSRAGVVVEFVACPADIGQSHRRAAHWDTEARESAVVLITVTSSSRIRASIVHVGQLAEHPIARPRASIRFRCRVLCPVD